MQQPEASPPEPGKAPDSGASIEAREGGAGDLHPLRPDRSLSPYVPPKAEPASRFPLLAAAVALAACLGAALGTAGHAAIERMLASPPPAVFATSEDLRALKAELAQVQKQIKAATEQLGTLRTAVADAKAAASTQFGKLGEALERAEKRAAAAATPAHAAAPSAEVTGTTPLPLPRPQIASTPLPGWIVRRVYDGVALIEGRDGIIEAEPGAVIPNLGRIQDIKRENGRWLVVTSRGVISSR